MGSTVIDCSKVKYEYASQEEYYKAMAEKQKAAILKRRAAYNVKELRSKMIDYLKAASDDEVIDLYEEFTEYLNGY